MIVFPFWRMPLVLLWFAGVDATPTEVARKAAPAAVLEYNRDIRPILADNCFRCHGPDSASRKADLRIDQRDAAIDAGVLTPGKPDESEMIRRILAEDASERMPPPSSHKKLSAEQKEMLRRWVAAGAEYQPHWSFIPPKRPQVPAVQNAAWVRNPIDAFILARLEKEGLAPAPEADRRTLARRLSLDLTGLPPDPAVVDAFERDRSPHAYERLVDRFLASQAWGEHRGRYWLDAARYADTHGIHFDNFREMWSYRDWVIRAFNRNLRFDQFTIEQLAGDLLPDATLDQRIASGFHRCNITTNEGGVIPEEYLVLYTRDRTETTSAVWLGLTANCAVCHDHKFDPLSQREFYELAAFFNNTTQGAMDGNIKDTPPVVLVPDRLDRENWKRVQAETAAVAARIEDRTKTARPDFDKWKDQARPAAILSRAPSKGLHLHAPLSEGEGDKLKAVVCGETREIPMAAPIAWVPGHAAPKAYKSKPEQVLAFPEAGNFEKDQPFSCAAWIKLPKFKLSGALVARMDEAAGHRGWDLWLDAGRLASHIIHNWPDDAVKVIAKPQIKPGKWVHVAMTYDGSARPEGLRLYVDGAPQEVEVAANTLKRSIRTPVPLKIAQRNSSSRVDGIAIQDLRAYERALSSAEVAQLATTTRAAFLVGKKKEELKPEEAEELFAWWLPSFDPIYQKLSAEKDRLLGVESAIKSRATVAHVMNEKTEDAMAYILHRGEYDKRKDPVKPKTPAVLPPMPDDLPRNRLGLAKWLLREEHPLTARVTVNRFWQEVFGTGLVRTAGDFGVSGELPSHPELLDWLAVEFRETGWDVKRHFKLMVMSSTYRQSAAATKEKVDKDPQNRLLSRGPRFRMDAEMVRDYALAASGLLVRKIGGPSVRPYQPEGVWEAVAMIGSNTRDYTPDKGENLYRRSVYTFWKRSAPPALMEIFNAPNRESCTVQRERTNTPLQALATLNDPQFVEAARRLAERTLKEGGESDATRFDYLGERLLARPLGPEEKKVCADSLAELVAYYRAQPAEAAKLLAVGESKPDPVLDGSMLASWTMLANELMNLDEVLNK